jgi:hypothetical protein
VSATQDDEHFEHLTVTTVLLLMKSAASPW